jgi:hypothetical protein
VRLAAGNFGGLVSGQGDRVGLMNELAVTKCNRVGNSCKLAA